MSLCVISVTVWSITRLLISSVIRIYSNHPIRLGRPAKTAGLPKTTIFHHYSNQVLGDNHRKGITPYKSSWIFFDLKIGAGCK